MPTNGGFGTPIFGNPLVPSRGLGCLVSLPDARDYPVTKLGLTLKKAVILPARVDLRETGHLPPVMDQGHLGSCTANGIVCQHLYDQAKQGETPAMLSRLWLYYQERVIEGTVASDAGAMPRDGLKVAQRYGVPREELWPYNVGAYAIGPPDMAYDAAGHKVLAYAAVPADASAIRQTLAQGFPVGFGMVWSSAFDTAEADRTGVLPMPGPKDAPRGGHFVVCVGYLKLPKSRRVYAVFQNSWSAGWGDGGFGYLPMAYLSGSHCFDRWIVSAVS